MLSASILLVGGPGGHLDQIRNCLHESGFSTASADDTATALALIEQEIFDLVMLHFDPSVTDGSKTIQAIRRIRPSGELPVLVLAQLRHWDDSLAATLDLGADDFVLDPVVQPVLMARVRACLSRKRSAIDDQGAGRRFRSAAARQTPSQRNPEPEADARDDTERDFKQAAKFEALGQLAGGIAHEINTPIQYIGDNLRFLESSFEDLKAVLTAYHKLAEAVRARADFDTELAKIEAVIQQVGLEYLQAELPLATQQSLEGVDHISSIVRAMKEFSHPSTRAKQPTDINRTIENSVLVCRSEWKHVAQMSLELDPTAPVVDTVPSELNQVLLNLVVNSAHAIEAAERQDLGTITISTRQRDGCLEIRVADNGTGIPKSIQQKIFDPFFTTKDVGKGTGQGLAIARNTIVNGLGGEISVESEVGKGTTFMIQLPLHGARRPEEIMP